MVSNLERRVQAVRAKDGGFTLIELLIVIVILGILAGIVVFAVSNLTSNGDTAACQADKKNVEVAIEAYKANSPGGSYPTYHDGDDSPYSDISPTYLREAPPSKYGITWDDTTGVVSATGC